MRFELLVVPDCPHAAAAEAVYDSVLARAGLSTTVVVVVVDDDTAAVQRGFVGSPSFFADGRDLLPAPGARPAVACRVYRDEHGRPSGLPTEQVLLAAIRARVRLS
ncbi:alkylmercury lyase [Flexivirga alba]|uniref:Alkylmercury lyase n=1 Tax=Flexivirga alba TaxID=702742 RepID=A0ABW2AEW1_9MICO